MEKVLKLNSAYMPIEIISFKKAFTLIARGKAEIIDTYENHTFNTFKAAYEAPAVIRLLTFIAPKKDLKFYKSFTRKHILERDNGECCYCGKELSLNKMTYDHVLPKSRGGQTNWNNIVSCCLRCNSKKNDKTPDEAGMKLIHKPYAPKIADNYQSGMISKLKNIPNILNNKKWLNYLYWNTPLEQDLV